MTHQRVHVFVSKLFKEHLINEQSPGWGAKTMRKSHLRLVAPSTVNCTAGPRRPKNAELRTREHLTPDEVERLIEAAKTNRHGHRDALMILLAFRHGLRAAEVADLR